MIPTGPDPGSRVEVIPGPALRPGSRAAILGLCRRAYEEEVDALYLAMQPVAHVLAWEGARLAAHAMWVDRRLCVGTDEPLRTAYVEFVATEPELQGRGLGTAVMRRLADEIRGDYRLAALCTGSPGFYARLGWLLWTGPLVVRTRSGTLVATPDETVMVLDVEGGLGPRREEPLSVEWREGELW